MGTGFHILTLCTDYLLEEFAFLRGDLRLPSHLRVKHEKVLTHIIP